MPLYGPKFPLKTGNRDTFEIYDNLESQISFFLKNLLMTSPGEKISDSNYGVGIRSFLFEQNIESSRSRIQSEISSQISIYMPYLDVASIEVSATDKDVDSSSLNVKIAYSFPDDDLQREFELDLDPDTYIGFY